MQVDEIAGTHYYEHSQKSRISTDVLVAQIAQISRCLHIGVLILDEVLSVGDLFFRKKSEARIKEMIHGGSTVLLVSHSTAVIRGNCTRAIWIEKGRLRAVGDPDQVCRAYENMEGG